MFSMSQLLKSLNAEIGLCAAANEEFSTSNYRQIMDSWMEWRDVLPTKDEAEDLEIQLMTLREAQRDAETKLTNEQARHTATVRRMRKSPGAALQQERWDERRTELLGVINETKKNVRGVSRKLKHERARLRALSQDSFAELEGYFAQDDDLGDEYDDQVSTAGPVGFLGRVEAKRIGHIRASYDDSGNPRKDDILQGSHRGARTRIVSVSLHGQPHVLKEYILMHTDTNQVDKEVRKLLKLQHPNIVKLQAAFLDGPAARHYCLQMPRYKCNLREWSLQEYKPSMLKDDRAIKQIMNSLLGGTLRAVMKVHSKGYVHNDIKQSNVFLTFDDPPTAVLGDFEFSFAEDGPDKSSSIDSSTSGLDGGTPAYLAPERAIWKQKGTASSDMYAVGVLILLTVIPDQIEEAETKHAGSKNAQEILRSELEKSQTLLTSELENLLNRLLNPEYECVQSKKLYTPLKTTSVLDGFGPERRKSVRDGRHRSVEKGQTLEIIREESTKDGVFLQYAAHGSRGSPAAQRECWVEQQGPDDCIRFPARQIGEQVRPFRLKQLTETAGNCVFEVSQPDTAEPWERGTFAVGLASRQSKVAAERTSRLVASGNLVLAPELFLASSASSEFSGAKTEYFRCLRPTAEEVLVDPYFTSEGSMPTHWKRIKGKFPSIVPVAADTPTMETIKRMVAPARPSELGVGRDALAQRAWQQVPREKAIDPSKRNIEVVRCWKLQNEQLWNAYHARKDMVDKDLIGGPPLHPSVEGTKPHTVPPGGPWQFGVRDGLAAGACEASVGSVDSSVNEVMLLHGLPAAAVGPVMEKGLEPRLAGGNAGNLFGNGTYLTEDIEKADMYVKTCDTGHNPSEHDSKSLGKRDAEQVAQEQERNESVQKLHEKLYPNHDHPGEVYYALVCRTLLGYSIRTKGPAGGIETVVYQPMDTGVLNEGKASVFHGRGYNLLETLPGYGPGSRQPIRYHSLIGELGHCIERFREFVVFESSLVYPEYLIAYQRVERDGAEFEPEPEPEPELDHQSTFLRVGARLSSLVQPAAAAPPPAQSVAPSGQRRPDAD